MSKTVFLILMTMIFNSMDGQNLSGTWLMIKDGATYGKPMFIEFENDQILHYEISEQSTYGALEKKLVYSEKLSETKNKLVNEKRIRLYRMGKTHTVISETESKTEDTEFATDYERIEPTSTNLSEKEIQEVKFKIEWNNEKFDFIFNETLDSKTIQEVNKRLANQGRKLILENMDGTYFGSIYDNGIRETLIAIQEIDSDKIILYGFPEEPYQVVSYEK
ncbi:MAG: hypothetical protein WBM91_17090 [Eudoraea sp.]|uniref:hypothetical protein n=1 Tax=Eudoraea sp. TaxID=1979955 RepID=UPI003C763303